MRSMRLVRSARIASVGLVILLVSGGWSGIAGAQVALDSPNLPPESDPPDCDQIVSQYVGIDVHALFPNGIEFSNPRHFCFQNVSIEPNPLTGEEFEFFDSTVEGTFDDGSQGTYDVNYPDVVRTSDAKSQVCMLYGNGLVAGIQRSGGSFAFGLTDVR